MDSMTSGASAGAVAQETRGSHLNTGVTRMFFTRHSPSSKMKSQP